MTFWWGFFLLAFSSLDNNFLSSLVTRSWRSAAPHRSPNFVLLLLLKHDVCTVVTEWQCMYIRMIKRVQSKFLKVTAFLKCIDW